LATGNLPTSTPRVESADIATTQAKKDCECCAKPTAEDVAEMRERLASLRKQQLAYQKAFELIRTYGLNEGLQHLKQSDPVIDEDF